MAAPIHYSQPAPQSQRLNWNPNMGNILQPNSGSVPDPILGPKTCIQSLRQAWSLTLARPRTWDPNTRPIPDQGQNQLLNERFAAKPEPVSKPRSPTRTTGGRTNPYPSSQHETHLWGDPEIQNQSPNLDPEPEPEPNHKKK